MNEPFSDFLVRCTHPEASVLPAYKSFSSGLSTSAVHLLCWGVKTKIANIVYRATSIKRRTNESDVFEKILTFF